MGDGAKDELRSYIRAGMPMGGRTDTCVFCGHVSYTGNVCRTGAPRLKDCPRNPDNIPTA